MLPLRVLGAMRAAVGRIEVDDDPPSSAVEPPRMSSAAITRPSASAVRSTSKIVPIVALSTASGWRFTCGSPNRCITWNRSPDSSSLAMVLSKSNFSSTSRMLGLNPAM